MRRAWVLVLGLCSGLVASCFDAPSAAVMFSCDPDTAPACPDGYTCEKLVTSIGGGISEGLTGSYCIKNTTKYDPAAGCTQGDRTPESDKAPAN